MQGLLGHGKEFGFYSECDEKLLNGFEQESDMVLFIFLMTSLAVADSGYEGVASVDA